MSPYTEQDRQQLQDAQDDAFDAAVEAGIILAPETIRTPRELLRESAHQIAKDACVCPVERDPFGTGDTWLTERDCQHPFRCPRDGNGGGR